VTVALIAASFVAGIIYQILLGLVSGLIRQVFKVA